MRISLIVIGYVFKEYWDRLESDDGWFLQLKGLQSHIPLSKVML